MQEALVSVGLKYADVKGKYPNQFSGGELQRVSVARALIPHPKIIIADEPVSMIDASLRMNVINLFLSLKQKFNTSFLYITHDLATAYYISDYLAVMYRGCIVEFGEARVVLTDPRILTPNCSWNPFRQQSGNGQSGWRNRTLKPKSTDLRAANSITGVLWRKIFVFRPDRRRSSRRIGVMSIAISPNK